MNTDRNTPRSPATQMIQVAFVGLATWLALTGSMIASGLARAAQPGKSIEGQAGSYEQSRPGCPEYGAGRHSSCGSGAGDHPFGYVNEGQRGLTSVAGNDAEPDNIQPGSANGSLRGLTSSEYWVYMPAVPADAAWPALTPTPTPTPTQTAAPDLTPTPSPTATPTPMLTPTPSPTATPTPMLTPTPLPTATLTPVELCGDLTSDTLLDQPLYLIWCNLVVAPGVTVRFSNAARYEIEVLGDLVVNGTAAQPVRFESSKPLPLPGDWGRIFLRPGSVAVLQSALLTDGGAFGAGLQAEGSSLTVVESEIGRSAGFGIWAIDTDLTLINSTIHDSATDGVRAVALTRPLELVMIGNTINASGQNAAFLSSSTHTSQLDLDANDGSGGTPAAIVLQGNFSGSISGGALPLRALLLNVPAGHSLALGPGTVFKQDLLYNGSQISAYGQLLVSGAAGNPVVFTSFKDDSVAGDTNGDGSSTAPAPGDWRSLAVHGSGELVMHDAVVRYGGYGNVGQLLVLSGALDMQRVTVADGQQMGLFAEDPTLFHVHDSIFERNLAHGLRLYTPTRYVEPVIVNNVFSHNAQHGLDLVINAGGIGSGAIAGNTGNSNGRVNGVYMEGFIADQISRLGYNPNFPSVVGTVREEPLAHLTLEPGGELKFGNRNYQVGSGTLLITGTLEAIGTASQPVVFTSFGDDSVGGDTNADGPSTGVPGDWIGLGVRRDSPYAGQLQLNYARVSYGGSLGAAIYNAGGYVMLDHAELLTSAGSGYTGTGNFTIGYSLLADHAASGFSTTGPGLIYSSAIMNNGAYGVWNGYDDGSGLYRLPVEGNYWGAADGPSPDGLPCFHEDVPIGSGDKVNCAVDWNPYLAAPPAVGVP